MKYKSSKNTKDNFIEEMIYMIKQLAWNTFKETGDIRTYLEFKEIKDIEEHLKGTEKIEK